jgi:hypothetical protein
MDLLSVLLLLVPLPPPDTPVQSGKPVGETVPYFHPLSVTGKWAGQKANLLGQFGAAPAVFVFVRGCGGRTLDLIKRLEADMDRYERLFVAVIVLTDDESAADRLKALAAKQKLERVILALDAPAGPLGWMIAKEAEVTVLLCRTRVVRANFAFRQGELETEALDKIERAVYQLVKKLKP